MNPIEHNATELVRLREHLKTSAVATFMVTGSRTWRDIETMVTALGVLPRAVMFHGAGRGLDEAAARWWWLRHGRDLIRRFPAAWDEFGPSAGPRRNREMVAAGPQLVLGFRDCGASPGTDGTLALAAQAGLPVFVFRTTLRGVYK